MDSVIVVFVEDYAKKKVKVKLSTREKEICVLCFGVSESELQPIATSPLAQEFNNFNFIETQIGYTFPEKICQTCLTKLNDMAAFIKMCKSSFATYNQIEERQKLNDQIDPHLDNLTPKCVNDSQKLSDENCETKDAPEVRKIPPNMPDALLDHLYYKNKRKTDNTNKKRNTQVKLKVCLGCDEKVPNLVNHYRKYPSCQPKNVQCTMCSLRFTDIGRMRNHQRIHHPDKVPVTVVKCHLCVKTFNSASNLTRHLRVHKYGKRFICEQCGKRYTTSVQLENHQNAHLNLKPYLCANCGKQFSAKQCLRSHERRCDNTLVTQNDRVACSICDRNFTRYGLKIHMHSHNEDKRCFCQKCKISFDTALLYRRHLKTHAKRDAECPFCFKKYPRSSLKQHINTHTTERPFVCAECGKRFRIQIHLTSHRLAVHNVNRGTPLKCKFCDRSFNFKGNLVIHERVHTGETPYPCHVCDEAFADTKKRKKHVAQVHGEDEIQNINFVN